MSSAVHFAGETRIHIGLDVTNVDRSVDFYRVLFGVEPVKRRPGYAKFECAEPRVNLSLNEGTASARTAGGSLHYGVQVKSTEAVGEAVARFRAAGLAVREEARTTCCYAVQDKVWVEDPDGNPWEVFVVLEADAERRVDQDRSGQCCVASAASPAASAAATA